MRGPDHQQPRLFYSFCPESLIPEDHPLRAIKRMVDEMIVTVQVPLNPLNFLRAFTE